MFARLLLGTRLFSFKKLFPLPQFHYQRGHWSHLQLDRFQQVQQHGAFTVFVQGASAESIAICKQLFSLCRRISFSLQVVVNQFATSAQVLQQLSTCGYIPYDNEGLLMLTTSAGCVLLPGESLLNAGLGALSHLWLQIHVLGGARQDESNITANESNPAGEVSGKRRCLPAGQVTDPSNIGELQLSSHQQAHEAAKSTSQEAEGSSSTWKCQADDVASDIEDVEEVGTPGGLFSKGKKHQRKHTKKSAGQAADLLQPAEIDANGMLKDIDVQEIVEITEAPSKHNKIRDVKYFFGQPYVDSDRRRVHNCSLCIKKAGAPKAKMTVKNRRLPK
ncbi:hypothetical protein IW261DRAFT_1424019 [Armillaria novae-zelandiae]|uniref:Uncharacterized protein n=1 Tax=Armillaria novae-zelandiae TaxID=153914 RepID=A0AA39NW66_9AGAR|nr:hypothetical protein IW261DRAFT_1424019 [Armillaria novae-zelandiae]